MKNHIIYKLQGAHPLNEQTLEYVRSMAAYGFYELGRLEESVYFEYDGEAHVVTMNHVNTVMKKDNGIYWSDGEKEYDISRIVLI